MEYKRCACCGEYTLEEKSLFDICPVCGWEDDGVQNDDPNYDGGANHISLNEAKKVWVEGNYSKAAIRAAKQIAWEQFEKQEQEAEKAPTTYEQCPCCGKNGVEVKNDFGTCETCGWVYDSLQHDNPDLQRKSNIISLNEAKKAWAEGKSLDDATYAVIRKLREQKKAKYAKSPKAEITELAIESAVELAELV